MERLNPRFHFNALPSRLSKLPIYARRGFNLWDCDYFFGSLLNEGFQTTPTLGGGPRFTPSFGFFAALRVSLRRKEVNASNGLFFNKPKTRCKVFLTIKCAVHTITFLVSGSCPPLRLTAGGRLLKMRQKHWTLTTMVSFMSAAPIKSWLRPVWSFQKDTMISFFSPLLTRGEERNN